MRIKWEHVHTGACTNYYEASLGDLGTARFEVNRFVLLTLRVTALGATRRVKNIGLTERDEEVATRALAGLLRAVAVTKSKQSAELASQCASICSILADIDEGSRKERG